MHKIVFKAGQEVVAQKDFTIESLLGGEPIQVKEGSKAFISADGFLHHTTGTAKGKIQKLSEDKFVVEGYDHENIAKLVWNKILMQCGIQDVLEDYDIDEKTVLEEIEYILLDIL